jgi:hypothetical protein
MPVRGEDVRAQNSGIPVMLGETMSFVNEWWRMTEVLRIQKVPK